jgi:hypothetical protein
VFALPGDVLQVRGDGAPDPRLDDAVHPVPCWNADIRGAQQHVIRERVTPEGEQDVVAPPCIVRGGEVQRDRDERIDDLHAGSLDVDVGDDGGLIVIIQRSRVTGGGGVGEGGPIRATVAWASSVRMATACCSSSRSAVAVRTRTRVASYLFFASAVVATMASSFC